MYFANSRSWRPSGRRVPRQSRPQTNCSAALSPRRAQSRWPAKRHSQSTTRQQMTVRKGEPWGQPAVCPADVRVVSTDRDVSEWIIWHRTRDQPIRDLGVSGGDLARTCGGSGQQRPCAARVTVDAMRVLLDGSEPTWGAAHVVARREWLRGDLAF